MSNNNKYIYTFEVNKKVKKEIVEESGDTKITRTVEVDEPVKVVLKKPNRSEWNNVQFEYGKEYGNSVRAGLLTKAMVYKLYSEDNFLEEQRTKILLLGDVLNKIQLDYQELLSKDDKFAEDDEAILQLRKDWEVKSQEFDNLQLSLQSIFENTAEARAEGHAITYLSVFQTFTEEGGQLKPVFRGDTLEQKLKHADALSESGIPFFDELMQKSGLILGMWYLNKAQTKEEFDALLAEPDKEPEESIVEEVVKDITQRSEEEIKNSLTSIEKALEKPSQAEIVNKVTSGEVGVERAQEIINVVQENFKNE
jgi:hypothetical protein